MGMDAMNQLRDKGRGGLRIPMWAVGCCVTVLVLVADWAQAELPKYLYVHDWSSSLNGVYEYSTQFGGRYEHVGGGGG